MKIPLAPRSSTTLGLANRLRDLALCEAALALSNGEQGNATSLFRDFAGGLVAIGFERLVLGDHGPYFEFRRSHLRWEEFVPWSAASNELGASKYFNEYRSRRGCVKLYEQAGPRTSHAQFVHIRPTTPTTTRQPRTHRPPDRLRWVATTSTSGATRQ